MFYIQHSILATLVSQFLFTQFAVADAVGMQNAPMIFDVRRSLPLEPDEPVAHDFYINAGVEAGFKKGMYITAVRVVNVHDPVQNKQQGELQIAVAKLHVIHVTRALTVARLESEFTDEERPTLEFEAVMIGDRIDPGSLSMEPPTSVPTPKKKSGSKKTRHETKVDPPSEAHLAAATDVNVVASPVPPSAQAPALTSAASASTAIPTSALSVPAAKPNATESGSAPQLNPPEHSSDPAKNTSQSANAPDMVRVPIPATLGASRTM